MNYNFYNGQKFSAIINSTQCNGKVRIEYGRIYLCQDIIDGAACNNKLGYRYSYTIGKVTDIFELPYGQVIDLILEEHSDLLHSFFETRIDPNNYITKDQCKYIEKELIEYLNNNNLIITERI